MKCGNCDVDGDGYCACADFFESYRAFHRGEYDHLFKTRASDVNNHPHAQRIAGALSRVRLRISNEAVLQSSIETTLTTNGIAFKREERLSKGDRPDFICDDVVIEAKAKYGKRSIYLQLQRYASHDSVAAIVLVTGTAMGMPPEINGKPVYVVSIGKAYL